MAKLGGLLFLMLSPLISPQALAYPEMIRYGYNNCTACHVSPTGAGLLTSYGRSLSAEVMSTFGHEKMAGVTWGLTDREALENYLLIGGDERSVQTFQEDANHKSAHWINMQAGLNLGLVREHWAAVIDIGQIEQVSDSDLHAQLYGTEFYGMYRPRDEFTVRAGRFTPAYGLHITDHIAFVRSYLDFGLNAPQSALEARDSVEAQWTGENWVGNLTHSKQFDVAHPEVANSVQLQYSFFERFKVAANYWSGSAQNFRRQMGGLWSVLGFTKHIYLLSEADLQTQNADGTRTTGFVSYNKLGYTVLKGLDLIFISEHLHTDLSVHDTITNRNGPGFQFYPVPHIEIQGVWTKQDSVNANGGEEDYAWLLFHYYI